MWKNNRVYIVGAGPGDFELITLKAMKVLREADVIICDRLVDDEVLRFAKSGAEIIRAEEKNEIYRVILQKVREGKKVVRLKNGDPFIFGRAVEEMEFLVKHGIRFSVIPGITAASAASCLCGIPLTQRGVSSSVLFVTGHEASSKDGGFIDWDKVVHAHTIVLYMGVKNISFLVKKIGEVKGKDTPVAVIERASLPSQRIHFTTLRDLPFIHRREKISAPAVIIVGDVVKNAIRFNWMDGMKKVLYTGLLPPDPFSDELLFHIPMVEVSPVKSLEGVKRFIADLPSMDMVLFSTPFSVSLFFSSLFELGKDARVLRNVCVGAVGDSTFGKLKEYGILPDLFAEGTENFVKSIPDTIRRAGLLLPASGDRRLKDALRNRGIMTKHLRLYRLRARRHLPPVEPAQFDEIVFPSSHSLRVFVKKIGVPPLRVKILVNTRKTYEEATKLGLIPEWRMEYAEAV